MFTLNQGQAASTQSYYTVPDSSGFRGISLVKLCSFMLLSAAESKCSRGLDCNSDCGLV